MNTEKKIQVIERSKLLRTLWQSKFSADTQDTLSFVIGTIRQAKGHDAAEAKAKEIRLLMESGINEEELLEKLEEIKQKELQMYEFYDKYYKEFTDAIERAKQRDKEIDQCKLLKYYDKNVKIISVTSQVFFGTVSDCYTPWDHDNGIESIVIDTPDGDSIEFTEQDIDTIEII